MGNFRPGATASLSASSVSSNVSIGGSPPGDVRIHNAGSVLVFLAFGVDSTVTATTSGFPVPPGAVEIVSIPGGSSRYVAGITPSGSATVYLTAGEGS